jgi:acetyl-CoA acetyltransferase
MALSRIQRAAAIAGIGATEFSKNSGRSEWRLATEAVLAAVKDAGISPTDIDGFVTLTTETNPEVSLAQSLGLEKLTFFSRVPYGGGGACALFAQAAMAISAGLADTVVCYRAFNERSGLRFGSGALADTRVETTETLRYSWVAPYGLRTPASWVAMYARRYLEVFAGTTDDFGQVTVSARKYAATNPLAYFFGRPIDLEDHRASNWVAEPLRVLDCCQETDGGQALVVTSLERARSLRHPPAVIVATAQGSAHQQEAMNGFYHGDLTSLPEMKLVGRSLWDDSGLKPEDIDAAILYDHFTPFILMQLEALGFCEPGEAADFIRGGAFELDGALPTNMNGGQLGEGYLHGLNGVAEAVRQIRGSAVNQVDHAESLVVTAGTGPPTSGLILAIDN